MPGASASPAGPRGVGEPPPPPEGWPGTPARPAAEAFAGVNLDGSTPALTTIEREFIALINRERGGHGLAALVPDARLTEAARLHSKEMCDLRYFDHRSPTPGLATPMDRFVRVLGGEDALKPPLHLLVGENIYHISEFDEYFDVEFGHRAIMKSPTHRATILEPKYTKVGVGVHRDARGELWTTEMFLRDAP